MTQYLIQVRDKSKIEFLERYGHIIHVAKLSSIVIFECTIRAAEKLKDHPDVIDVRQSDTFQLASM